MYPLEWQCYKPKGEGTQDSGEESQLFITDATSIFPYFLRQSAAEVTLTMSTCWHVIKFGVSLQQPAVSHFKEEY